MKIPSLESIKTANEARLLAIHWQAWTSDQHMSYQELTGWQALFEVLATKFNLTGEFRENCII